MENHNADNRKRMKEEYSEPGGGAFEDSQLLEMLLSYSVPHENTALLAKSLLDKFGSLDNLLNADMAQIAPSDSREAEAARLIKLTADIGRRAHSDIKNLRSAKDVDEAAEYFTQLLGSKPEENFAVMLLDSGNKVKYSGIISEGSVNTANVTMLKLAQLVLNNGAKTLIIAHNHPNGIAKPSDTDINTTNSIRDFMNKLGVTLTDHIIVGADSVYSMRHDSAHGKYFAK